MVLEDNEDARRIEVTANVRKNETQRYVWKRENKEYRDLRIT